LADRALERPEGRLVSLPCRRSATLPITPSPSRHRTTARRVTPSSMVARSRSRTISAVAVRIVSSCRMRSASAPTARLRSEPGKPPIPRDSVAVGEDTVRARRRIAYPPRFPDIAPSEAPLRRSDRPKHANPRNPGTLGVRPRPPTARSDSERRPIPGLAGRLCTFARPISRTLAPERLGPVPGA
jgi:hypothetical protein